MIPDDSATRPLFDLSHVAPPARASMAEFHPDVLRAVRRALAESPVVVVGMAQNPVVKRVRGALNDAGIPFHYVEYGSYFSKWRERLAIKMWTGWPTFPQVFVRGVLIGGHDLTVAALADGSLRRALESSAT